MEVFETFYGDVLEITVTDSEDVAVDLSDYDEAESFLRLQQDDVTSDHPVTFNGGEVKFVIDSTIFAESGTMLGQVFLRKKVLGVLTKNHPTEIFKIEVFAILEAPTP